MDMSPAAAVRLLLPKLPMILRTATMSALSLSQTSSKQDTMTEVTVAIIRSFVMTKAPVGKMQKYSLRDPGIKGPMWISKVTIPQPGEKDVLDAVLKGVDCFPHPENSFTIPSITAVEGEWTGHRSGVADKNTPRPDLSEEEQYASLMKEVSSDVTVLYFHGGAYFLMDPASHRVVVSNLAKRTKGRCFSVRYRLAPQNPFPAQLLDALISYLYLLSPPPGSLHTAIPAKNIVFAGDSAGGHLATTLMLLILTLTKNGIDTVNFHGKPVRLELPAGVATNSPWLEVTNSLPSCGKNAPFDYLDLTQKPDAFPPATLADDIWPSSPPRAELLCSAHMFAHPLVSPLYATSEMWEGSPPVFMCAGEECLRDGIEVTARRMHLADVYVEVAGYEGMPHCFAMVFENSPAAQHCMDKWARFCVNAVEGILDGPGGMEWMIAFSKAKQFYDCRYDDPTLLSDEDVRKCSEAGISAAIERERVAIERWQNSATAGSKL